MDFTERNGLGSNGSCSDIDGSAARDGGSQVAGHVERLVNRTQLTNSEELVTRKKAWADAYQHTPHGQRVELSGATGD